MGQALAKLFGLKNEIRVLMLGLDEAGKTAILYKMYLGGSVTTIPTIGFNSEEVTINNIRFGIWVRRYFFFSFISTLKLIKHHLYDDEQDLGGQDKIRPLWRHYYYGTEALVFVVDSQNTKRLGEAQHELFKILDHHEMKNVVLLVLANKSDLKGALSKEEIIEALNLNAVKCPWHIESTSTIAEWKGDGIEQGFSWLAETLRPKKKDKKKHSKQEQTKSKLSNNNNSNVPENEHKIEDEIVNTTKNTNDDSKKSQNSNSNQLNQIEDESKNENTNTTDTLNNNNNNNNKDNEIKKLNKKSSKVSSSSKSSRKSKSDHHLTENNHNRGAVKKTDLA